jgi:hypothetical protein
MLNQILYLLPHTHDTFIVHLPNSGMQGLPWKADDQLANKFNFMEPILHYHSHTNLRQLNVVRTPTSVLSILILSSHYIYFS